jgi:outer membrane receptor protein involved in Fe transport
MSTTPQYIFGATQSVASAAAVLTLGNPALKWETTTQTNVGVDLALFANKLNFSADYWVKNTDGILLRTPISAATGINRDNGSFQNAASVQNSGFEFLLSYCAQQGDLTRWRAQYRELRRKRLSIRHLHPHNAGTTHVELLRLCCRRHFSKPGRN